MKKLKKVARAVVKDVRAGLKVQQTAPFIVERLSEKYLPKDTCTPGAPCWICRYARAFLCLERRRNDWKRWQYVRTTTHHPV